MKFSLALGLAFIVSPVLAAGGNADNSRSAAPATGYSITPLVSDQAGVAPNTDPDLINPWGLTQSSDGAPLWDSDNGTDKSTLYNRFTGAKESLVVAVSTGAPTGIVAVPGSAGFVVTKNGTSGPATFIYDTESGAIEGWSSTVDSNNTVVGYDGSAKGSVFKGLAYDSTSNLLFAADFVNKKVEVFNNKFKMVGKFTDPGLPKTFAPFNVAALNGKIYVAFAKRKKGSTDEKDGRGLGYVDIFDTSGNLLKQLIATGPLNAPWALTIAPSGFGAFAGDLLVGNFGDGKINVFDPASGAMLGTLSDSAGKALTIDGLWALDNGPGPSKVEFTSGPGAEAHGLIGVIAPN